MLFRFEGKLGADWAEERGCVVLKTKGKQFIAFDYACPHYDSLAKKCRIYENRPLLCRSFPVGCLDCLLCRKTKGIKELPEKE